MTLVHWKLLLPFFSAACRVTHISSKMSSGVTVPDKVIDVINRMRLPKSTDPASDRIRLIVLHIANDSIVEVERLFREKDVCDKENMYKFVLEQMPLKSCRYLLYDCHYETMLSPKEELVFIMWAPDNGSCKEKMLYASSKNAVTKILQGVKVSLQVNDAADYVEMENFAKELGKEVTAIEGICCGKH